MSLLSSTAVLSVVAACAFSAVSTKILESYLNEDPPVGIAFTPLTWELPPEPEKVEPATPAPVAVPAPAAVVVTPPKLDSRPKRVVRRAPRRVPSKVIASAPPAPQPEIAPENERLALRQIHQALRVRFILAAANPPAVDTQVAQVVDTQPEENFDAFIPMELADSSVPAAPVDYSLDDLFEPQGAWITDSTPIVRYAAPMAEVAGPEAPAKAITLSAPSEAYTPPIQIDAPAQAADSHEVRPETPDAPESLPPPPPAHDALPAIAPPVDTYSEIARAPSPDAPEKEELLSREMNTHVDGYSSRPRPKPVTTHATESAQSPLYAWNAPEAPAPLPPPPAPPKGTEGEEDRGGSIDTAGLRRRLDDFEKSFRQPAPPEPGKGAVEAFREEIEVPGAAFESFSAEGSQIGAHSRWIKVSATSHWPTLSWATYDPEWSPSQYPTVPVVSGNTALMLATLGSSVLQPEAGIIFGRLPAGWKLELSGRADGPIYLDRDEPVLSSDDRVERRFVFVNVAPGAHLLYLVGSERGARVPVGAIALGGHATYLPLVAPKPARFRGFVYDASSARAKGLKGISVRILGQSPAAMTSPSGAFELNGVLTVGEFPVFLETDSRDGFTHRYRILPEQADSVGLFRFEPRLLHAWLSQLEGGVSTDSGLLVAAVPPTALEKTGEAFASTRPILAATTLTPETYALSAQDRLLVDAPLEAAAPRFLAVQLPDGPSQATVEDKAGRTVWSEIVFASPRVINVAGPR